MTEENANHWQSLAADLTGKPLPSAPEVPEKPVGKSKTNEPAASPSDEDLAGCEAVNVQRPAQAPDPAPDETASKSTKKKKKKKGGGWAFWRSRSKDDSESMDDQENVDPLSMLKSAETTEDVVSVIDQLFSVDTTRDTRQDEIVFDEADTVDSISFSESEAMSGKPRAKETRDSRRRGRGRSRDSNASDSDARKHGDREARSRSTGDNRRQRNDDREDHRGDESRRRNRPNERESEPGRGRQRSNRRSSSRDKPGASERRNGDRNGPERERAQEDIPSWETAVCYVVDKNMTTRSGTGGKTKGKSKSKSRRRRKDK